MDALRRTMASDGAWSAHKLIFKGVRAYHGSRTLTTTFTLKAALAWDGRLHAGGDDDRG